MSSSGEEYAVGLVVFVVCIGIWSFFYPSSNEALEVKCHPGSMFNTSFECLDKNVDQGALLQFFPERQSQKVLIKVLKRDNNWLVDELYLKGCDVISDDQWRCQTGDAELRRTYGMSNGIYYTTLIGGEPPDFYTTSISGWKLFAWNVGADFKSIANFSWTGPASNQKR